MDKYLKDHKSYIYAKSVIKNTMLKTGAIKELVKNYKAPKYVIKQCKNFVDIAEGKDERYEIDIEKVKKIDKLLKLLIMPKGLKAGQTIYECTCGYQWLFYVAILCIVCKDDKYKRRYETAILEICRKNFKTYTIATVFILLFLLEPRFSKFYSVAPDGSLSREVKDAIEMTIKSSPYIYDNFENEKLKNFKILRDSITCLLTDTTYAPLAYTNSRFDGKLPNVFLADEVGALPSSYAIEAMRSGQLNIKNKLGCIISTKYPTSDNPFEDEIGYAKKILDNATEDDKVFSLLYEPDDIKDWATDDLILKQGNPVALENIEIWDDLISKRKRAIEIESARENFLTKHCNIIYQNQAETFINTGLLKDCKVNKVDFKGANVYVGVDLAMTNDNVSVAIVKVNEDEIIEADVYAFIPEGRIKEKIATENVDYIRFIESGKCIACGDMTVDYAAIEKFVFDIEKRFNCTVCCIGYDRYNALSSAQKWDTKYTTIQIRQHSDTLHAPTKLLEEKITNKEFRYADNKLLEINFQNARCQYDTNLNRYVNKKKSSGKVDMVVSLINALYLAQQDIIFGDNSWGAQY